MRRLARIARRVIRLSFDALQIRAEPIEHALEICDAAGQSRIGAGAPGEVVAHADARIEAGDPLFERDDALFERRRLVGRLGTACAARTRAMSPAAVRKVLAMVVSLASGCPSDSLLAKGGPRKARQIASTIAFSVELGRIARAVSLGSGW